MKKYGSVLLSLIVLCSCAVQKDMLATGGSKADGTVDVSYEYGLFEQPIVNPQQGLESAVKRCKGWGYKNAESFDAARNQCLAFNGYGDCVQTRVTMTYQCLAK